MLICGLHYHLPTSSLFFCAWYFFSVNFFNTIDANEYFFNNFAIGILGYEIVYMMAVSCNCLILRRYFCIFWLGPFGD